MSLPHPDVGLTAASRAYEVSAIATCKVRLVAASEAERLVDLRGRFPRPVESGNETPFERAGQWVRRAVWNLNVTLGPVSDLGLEQHAVELRALESKVRLTEGDHAAEQVLEGAGEMAALGSLDIDPLGGAILVAISEHESEERVLVVPSSSMDRALAWIKAEGLSMPVLQQQDMVSAGVVDHMLIVGAPQWYSPAAVTAPRGSLVEFVQFNWLRAPPAMSGVLPTSSSGVGRSFVVVGRGGSGPLIDPEDLPPSPNWSAVASQGAGSTDDSGEEVVEARPILLSGDYAALVRYERGAEVLCGVPTDTRFDVVRVAVDAIEPGMYLMFRTSGSDSDFIKEIADSRFGVRNLRPMLDVWKRELRDQIGRFGVRVVQQQLRKRGARTANVAYWASADTIRPRSHHDFRVLLEYLGFEEKGPAFMEAADQVFGAHIQAGHYVRGLLEDEISRSDLESSGGVLRIELERGDGGELTVLRVMRVSDQTFSVPESAVKLPFPVEEAAWVA